MRLLKILSVAISLMLLSGCTTLLLGGAGAGGYMVGKDERSVKTIASDASITTKINALFVAEKGIKTMGIDVDTYDGVVTLYGKISSAQARSKAISIAQSVKGVKSVTSKLSIIP